MNVAECCQSVAKFPENQENRLPLRKPVVTRLANKKRAESLVISSLLPSLTSGKFHYVLSISTHHGKLENHLGAIPQGFESLTFRP